MLFSVVNERIVSKEKINLSMFVNNLQNVLSLAIIHK